MSVIRELDPELHLKLIEGYQDELSAEARALDVYYRHKGTCKRCGSTLHREYDRRIAWNGDGVLPRSLLTCRECGFSYDPHSDIIINSGSASKIPTDRHEVPSE